MAEITATCPHCKRGGIHPDATRCHHCSGEFGAYSETPAYKAELRAKAILETINVLIVGIAVFSMPFGWTTGIIVAAVFAALVFFTKHLKKFLS